ncbi:MAG: DNA gyrase inhibitor YacG [Gammaproteobacteria bacterium]|nr:DNA gyrase inhibitor YacG [Gammaproteobacteria bacterium]
MKCPSCSRPIEWNDGFPFRPFCSERCRMVDLGAWLTESHVIPGESIDDLDLREATPAAGERPS